MVWTTPALTTAIQQDSAKGFWKKACFTAAALILKAEEGGYGSCPLSAAKSYNISSAEKWGLLYFAGP